MFEVEAMTRVRLNLPPTSLVKVPKIHHFDSSKHIIIMEDCGTKSVTLTEFLSSGGGSSLGVAETIGTAVGEFIGLVHEWSRSNPDGILDTFEKGFQTKEMIADLSYNRLVTTLLRSDKDDLPLLSDLEIDPSDIHFVSKLMDEYYSHLMSARVPGHDVVCPFPLKWLRSVLSRMLIMFNSSLWETFGTRISSSTSTSTRFVSIFWIGNSQGQDCQAPKSASSAPTWIYSIEGIKSPVGQHQ